MAKVKAKKIEVTETLVKESLPEPPQGYSYDVQRVTPQVIKIRLCHDDADYSYTTEKVWSIYGFVKRDMVHPPRNSEKMRVSPLCHLSELRNQSPYTTIVPTTNSIIELLS